MLIVAVLITITIEVFNQETSHRIIIEKKVKRLRKETGRDDLRSCYDTNQGAKLSQSRILINGLVRPLKMLVLSPIVLLLTIYISFTYGTLYLLFTTIPTVFEETYGFSIGLTGLVYLGLGAGTTLGWLVITLYSDKSVIKLAKANNGEFEPEMRLAMSIGFSWLLPITFFWYGWTAQYKVHWISPILSLIPYGCGIMGLFLPITTLASLSTLIKLPVRIVAANGMRLTAPQISRRLLPHVRRGGHRCKYGASKSRRCIAATRRPSYVPNTWPGLGQLPAGIPLHPHDSPADSVLQIRQEIAQDGEAYALKCLLLVNYGMFHA